MQTKFKLKYFIVAMVIMAFVLACAAFSVSYAKWSGTGLSQATAMVGTGTWKKSLSQMQPDEVINLVKAAAKPSEEEPEFGGILVNHGDDIRATATWKNKSNGSELNYFEGDLELTAGDMFAVVFYGRFWQMGEISDESGLIIKYTGFCIFGESPVDSAEVGDCSIQLDNVGKFFTVKRNCKIHVKLSEGSTTNKKLDDVLTITGTETDMGKNVTIHYPVERDKR